MHMIGRQCTIRLASPSWLYDIHPTCSVVSIYLQGRWPGCPDVRGSCCPCTSSWTRSRSARGSSPRWRGSGEPPSSSAETETFQHYIIHNAMLNKVDYRHSERGDGEAEHGAADDVPRVVFVVRDSGERREHREQRAASLHQGPHQPEVPRHLQYS